MRRGLARFAAITAVAFVLSRVLGLLRDLVIAARFGLGPEFDAYVLALLVPDLLFILISGGAIGSAFIPVFTGLYGEGREREAWGMASGVLLTVCVVIAALSAAAWLLAPVLIRDVLARGSSDAETQQLAVDLMRIVLLQPLFLVLASVFTSVLQSFDRFTIPAFAPIAYNGCVILGALLLAPFIGMRGVAIGVVAGALAYALLQVPAVRRVGFTPTRPEPLADPNVRRTFSLLLPRIAGQAAVQVNTMVALALASGLGPERASAYRLASVLFVLPVGLFGTSIATVSFPALSREAVARDRGPFLDLLRRAIRGVLFFVLPAAAGLIALREPVISLLYERGEFTHSDTLLTAVPLLYFSLGMWAYALVDVLPRAFYALQDSVTPVKIGVATVVLDIALSVLLVGPMGLGGPALAFSLALAVQVALLLRALQRRVGGVLDREALRFTARALLATAVMLGTLLLVRPLLDGYARMPAPELLVRIVMTIAAGTGAYAAASAALRQEEIGTLLRLARR